MRSFAAKWIRPKSTLFSLSSAVPVLPPTEESIISLISYLLDDDDDDEEEEEERETPCRSISLREKPMQ